MSFHIMSVMLRYGWQVGFLSQEITRMWRVNCSHATTLRSVVACYVRWNKNYFSELKYFLLSLRLGVTKTIKKELKWPKEKNEIV